MEISPESLGRKGLKKAPEAFQPQLRSHPALLPAEGHSSYPCHVCRAAPRLGQTTGTPCGKGLPVGPAPVQRGVTSGLGRGCAGGLPLHPTAGGGLRGPKKLPAPASAHHILFSPCSVHILGCVSPVLPQTAEVRQEKGSGSGGSTKTLPGSQVQRRGLARALPPPSTQLLHPTAAASLPTSSRLGGPAMGLEHHQGTRRGPRAAAWPRPLSLSH